MGGEPVSVAWNTVLVGVLADGATLACVGTVLGWCSRFGWPWELASHFRPQYALILAVGATSLVVAGRLSDALIASGFLAANLWSLLPLYRWRHRVTAAHTLTVLWANVWHSNRSYDRIERLLALARPDVVFLAEVDQEQLENVQGLKDTYPFAKGLSLGKRNFGIMVLSRLPVERAEVCRIGGHGLPSVVARLRWGDQVVTLIGTHPASPTTPRRLALRDRQLGAIATFVAQQPGPVIVVGDFNTTSWSAVFRRLLATSGLRDSRSGFGLQSTWPSWLPLLRIPIDHCLISKELAVVARRVAGGVGSDHYPVVIQLAVREESRT